MVARRGLCGLAEAQDLPRCSRSLRPPREFWKKQAAGSQIPRNRAPAADRRAAFVVHGWSLTTLGQAQDGLTMLKQGPGAVQPSRITLRRPHGPWVCSTVVRLRAERLVKMGNTRFARTIVAVESFETVGETMIYRSVNHGPNIQPTMHRVWCTMICLGRTVVSQRRSPRSSSEVSHDHASSLAKVFRNDKGGNLEQREKEHAKGLWPWDGPRWGDFSESSDPVWRRSLRAIG